MVTSVRLATATAVAAAASSAAAVELAAEAVVVVVVVVVVVTDKVLVEDLEVKRDREVVEVVMLVTLVKPSLGLLARTIPSMRKCLTLDSPAMARLKVESMRTQEQSVR